MKLIIPQPINNHTIYKRVESFENIEISDLEKILEDIERKLDCSIELLKREKYDSVYYNIDFYRGEFNYDVFGDILHGSINLFLENRKEDDLNILQEDYKRSFEKIRDEFAKDPGQLNIKVLIEVSGVPLPVKIISKIAKNLYPE